MLKEIVFITFGLFIFQFPSIFVGAIHSMTADTPAGQVESERVSTIQMYANADNMKEMVPCTEPRPELCTQDYRPVCAVLKEGGFKTYSNGCNACSDPSVTEYRDGACE